MRTIGIPEGFELLAGRGRENAKLALERAEDRGFDSSVVLTHPEGYLVPVDHDEVSEEIESVEDEEEEEPEEVQIPAASAPKAEQEAFAAEHGIDLSETTNAETRHAAIVAWAETQKEN